MVLRPGWVQYVCMLRALLSSSSSPVCRNESGTNVKRMFCSFCSSPTPKGWSQHSETYTFLNRLSTLLMMVSSTVDGGAVQSASCAEVLQNMFPLIRGFASIRTVRSSVTVHSSA